MSFESPLDEANGAADGSFFSISKTDGNVYLNYVAPEPSTLVLLGIGTISLLTYGWRKRKG